MNAPIKILLAEDHHLVRQGLRLILEREPSFRLVAEASDGLQAVQLTVRHHPDVLILDLMLPRLHGLEVARRVRQECPSTQILVVSMHSDATLVVEALRAGVCGYLLKDATATDLVQGVRETAAGRQYLSPSLVERAVAGFLKKPGEKYVDSYSKLTNRERLVLQLAAEGNNNVEVATRLFISPRTAETHRANLMRKLGLRSQTELVRFAIRRGLITP